jgi:antitoxin component of RelBE/YafQ-DinJ toxin-antitoxin module
METTPYQFWVDKDVLREAQRKVTTSGLGMPLAVFMRMALEQIAEQPFETSLAQLRKHQTNKNRRTNERRK